MRTEFERIAAFVPEGGAVLDLGCGEGDMLEHLRQRRRARGVGADIDGDNLVKCIEKGVSAVYCDISRELALFGNDDFDAVILSDTLQSVSASPQRLLSEMLRIGRSAVVSFPNFGYWRLRMQLLTGSMPVGRGLPHQWHNTPNVRYCTITDFEELCRSEGLPVLSRVFLCAGGAVRRVPNFFAETAIYHIGRPGLDQGGESESRADEAP